VVGQRILGLRDADGEVREALPDIGVHLRPGELAELDLVGTVHLAGDGSHFLLNGEIGLVEQGEVLGLAGGYDDTFGEVDGAFAAFGPMVRGDCVLSTGFQRLLADDVQLSLSIGPTERIKTTHLAYRSVAWFLPGGGGGVETYSNLLMATTT